MTAETDLLPCPFCGSGDIGESHVSTYSVDSSYDVFGCRSCGARFESGTADDWNRRACVSSATEALRELAESRHDEMERLRDGWHMANGTAELAMKHRDAAEARAERLAEALRDMLDEYGQLHAKFDLGECQATMNARAALEQENSDG